jgi:hypothetical protein
MSKLVLPEQFERDGDHVVHRPTGSVFNVMPSGKIGSYREGRTDGWRWMDIEQGAHDFLTHKH